MDKTSIKNQGLTPVRSIPLEQELKEAKEDIKEQRTLIYFGLFILLAMLGTIIVMIGLAVIQSNSDRINYDSLLMQTQFNAKLK
jgi:hypothetical protein